MIKDLIVFSLKLFFLIEAFLRKAKQCNGYSICFILTIINLKMVTKKLLSATDLKGPQIVYIYKLLKVILVSKNKNLVFAAL